MKVIVAGGGIAGMSVALSLHAAGIDATVFESAPRIQALGLGIHLQPNAVRELFELGLAAELTRNAVPIEELGFHTALGQRVWAEPRGLKAGYRWPQLAINRGTLQVLLLEAVQRRLGAGHVVAGQTLEAFEQDRDGVTAHFRDRTTGGRLTVRGDVLIGADGLHSVVRKHFYPVQPLRYGGQLMWRSAAETEPFLGGRTFIIAGHREQKIVAYPMFQRPDGRMIVNWIVELGTPGDGPPREEWNRTVDTSLFADAFANWRFDWLDVPSLIDAGTAVFEFPKVDRDPIPQWTFGRVTLIGDAAHPMHPTGSQAGSQAVVDARALAHCLATQGDPYAGLAAYQEHRLPPMRELALHNRTLGPERVLDLATERAPGGFTRVEDVLAPEELRRYATEFKELAGFAVDQLNNRPSYSVSVT
ncbi:flavin-dependent oxidoreductase [Streptomyces sp. GbtcB6]|uniref:flavin-dependent oxidoreductase n=1 Tax=Streptomyces sp. GbtcB6 TaxID=2824751 RepID=UPI001C2FCDDA|nr:flavin-dependent oxidoreductase [Streptomyces sp. GbtcB6]